MDEGIGESVLSWFGHIETIRNIRIARRVYGGKCMKSRLIGRPRKKWIDYVSNCLKKKKEFWDVGQERRMMYGKGF